MGWLGSVLVREHVLKRAQWKCRIWLGFLAMARAYPLNVVGRQVAKIRSDRGLSQADLAAACQRIGWDITRDTVAKIEGGFRWVGDTELIHLANETVE